MIPQINLRKTIRLQRKLLAEVSDQFEGTGWADPTIQEEVSSAEARLDGLTALLENPRERDER